MKFSEFKESVIAGVKQAIADGKLREPHPFTILVTKAGKVIINPTDEQLAAINAVNGVKGMCIGAGGIITAFAMHHPLIGMGILTMWLYDAYLSIELNGRRKTGKFRFSH